MPIAIINCTKSEKRTAVVKNTLEMLKKNSKLIIALSPDEVSLHINSPQNKVVIHIVNNP
ncbi:hypothetical protein CXF67_09195 [Psychroflexus sp. MES1-P1E]|nr:hypothetical protein CXF67_09195 [Psychroflexus sp. MES1-P1E]